MGSLEWQMAKEWIISTGIKPLHGKPLEENVDLIDFAQSLRDGVILCQVINILKPGTINDVSTLNNIHMHMFLCLRNIRAFLRACTDVFKLDQKDLFKAQDLYDVSNFQAVIKTLSILSKSYESLSLLKLQSFPPDDFSNHKGSDSEDVYGTLPDILDKQEPSYYNYDEDKEGIYDKVQMEEKIYDDIVHCFKQSNQVQPLLKDKRSYIVNEIVETEKNYLNALKVMVEEYIKPLKGHMSSDDKEIIFMNTEQIYILHSNFNRELTTKSTTGIPKLNIGAFSQYKERFTIYATYCTDLPEAQIHITELCKESGFEKRVEGCNVKAKRKFPLREQLAVPFQRILKYPLLLRDLNKQTPATHEEKAATEYALAVMDDIAKYINEFKRDAENVKTIAKIESSIKYDLNGQGVKPNQYGKPIRNGELMVKFDTNDKKTLKRIAFLFEHSLLLCKSRSDIWDVKEIFDLQKFRIGEIPPAGKGKFSQGWSMQAHKSDGVCEAKNCTMFAKSQQEKEAWVNEVTNSIKAVCLTEWQGKIDKHQLELTTFEGANSCHVCKFLLRGQISQGYKCMHPGCSLLIHRDCLSKCPQCNPAPHRPAKPLKTTPTVHLKPNDALGLRNSRQNSVPSPPSSAIRPLSPGYGHHSSNSSLERGLNKYPWFAGVLSRDEASQILCTYGDGSFLIRESPNQPGLAISIRYKTETKHIKIGNNNNRYYITDPKQFPSVNDLVTYYKNNSLGISFPTLPTKLTKGVGKPIKRTMTAKYSWTARNEKELSFRAGQVVNVIHDDCNWWYGECCGKEGFFPMNYVE